MTPLVIIPASQLVVNQNGELMPMMSESPPNQSSQPDDWFTGLPPVHVITAAEDSTVVTFHQCECNVPLKQRKKTKKTNKRGGSRPLQASSVRETDAAPLRGLFANDQHLFSLRVRRRLQLQYTHSLPFLCTTVTGSAHCLAHTEETELDHFLDVSSLFLYKRETLKSILVVTPLTPRTPPPHLPTCSRDTCPLFFFLPPPDHHC